MTTSTLSFEQDTNIKVVNYCDDSIVDGYQGDLEEGELTPDELEEGEIQEPLEEGEILEPVIKIEPRRESTRFKKNFTKVVPTKKKVWKCPQCNLALCDCMPWLITSSDDQDTDEEKEEPNDPLSHVHSLFGHPSCEEEYAQAQRVASDMRAYFTARRELHDLMTMAEQEFEVAEPAPNMNVSNNTDLIMDDFDDINIDFDHETLFGLNTSSYHFDYTQEQNTSTEVQVEEETDFPTAHLEREAHQTC
jgi:hypothetical protein